MFLLWGIENFYVVFPNSFKERVTKTGIFQLLSKMHKCCCPNKWCSCSMPLLLHFRCPKPVQITCSGSITHPLTHRHRRLLTQKWKFSQAYYYKVEQVVRHWNAISVALWLEYLQSSLYFQVSNWVGITSRVDFASKASQVSYGKIVTSYTSH